MALHYISKMLTQSEMKNFWIGGAIYEKCYQDKGCFGTPDNCVAKRNCDMLGKQLILKSWMSFEFESNLK